MNDRPLKYCSICGDKIVLRDGMNWFHDPNNDSFYPRPSEIDKIRYRLLGCWGNAVPKKD